MQDMLDRIDRYVQRLSEPISPKELGCGWSPDMASKWRNWFVALREKVVNNVPMEPTALNSAYGMGYDGIDWNSELADEGAGICNDLCKMHAESTRSAEEK